MVEELRKYFSRLLHMVEGLEAIIITDRDGVPVIKVTSEAVPEHALKPAFLATFAMAADQASKLGLSHNKSIICMYGAYQVVQFNELPLVISLIASSTANTGLLLCMESELQGVLQELKTAIEV
ncbi:ragulator complex protein LAMTOR3-A-like [Acanthaster planci]|uniref:Ragulator complex protein LAMTOR3-A-like n=1 Tax=Acanthaster planci TaxID=133434 RepID=A0A8B7ZG06_ACAPL|nr:ragulator complex protein LAMTOR3-A-like [Acanthaster planci]